MLCFDFCARYTETEIEALENKHTKQLLKMRDSFYHNSEYCQDLCGDKDECFECLSNLEFNKAAIKRILSTREHIPNKQESKALRKQRIKEGR
jgi:hypothetical protein